MNDEELYLKATNEVDAGEQHPAIWAKAVAVMNGDHEKAKYEYIRLRVTQLATHALREERPVDVASSIPDDLSSDEEVTRHGCTYVPLTRYCKEKAVSKSAALKLIREGEIKGIFYGDSWFVRKEELGAGNVVPAAVVKERIAAEKKAEKIRKAKLEDYAQRVRGPMKLSLAYFGFLSLAGLGTLIGEIRADQSSEDIMYALLAAALFTSMAAASVQGMRGRYWAVVTVFSICILLVLAFFWIVFNSASNRAISLAPIIIVPALIAYRLRGALDGVDSDNVFAE